MHSFDHWNKSFYKIKKKWNKILDYAGEDSCGPLSCQSRCEGWWSGCLPVPRSPLDRDPPSVPACPDTSPCLGLSRKLGNVYWVKEWVESAFWLVAFLELPALPFSVALRLSSAVLETHSWLFLLPIFWAPLGKESPCIFWIHHHSFSGSIFYSGSGWTLLTWAVVNLTSG